MLSSVGISLEKAKELVHLMQDPTDQARYGDPGALPAHLVVLPPKTDRAERDEQKQFANWLLLHELPFCWHATHKRTTANLGVPDFWVGCWSGGVWIEFKRWRSALSPEQEKFWNACVLRGIPIFLVYTAQDAIAITKKYDTLR
jgi:hypothetical protein